jgi:dTMP kinase
MNNNISKGKFIVFEGGEASGKSTQIEILKDRYKNDGNYVFTKEPGGTKIADEIREILITGDKDKLLPLSELALFYAARYEHLQKLVIPSLNQGKNVFCDRFYISTIVYQGMAQNVSMELIEMLNKHYIANIYPDHNFILDIDPKISFSRVESRNKGDERYEKYGMEFHQKIRDGFLSFVKELDNSTLIDASQDIKSIELEIATKLETII